MKNMKKGMSWLLVCVMLMGLIPINVSSAVDETADVSTTVAASEDVAEDADKTEATTAVEVSDAETVTEADAATESTTVVETDNTDDTITVTETTTEVATAAETTEKTTEVQEKAAEKSAVKRMGVTETGLKPLASTHDLVVDSIVVEVNGERLKEGGTTDVKIKDKDNIDISISWSIPNDKIDVNTGDMFVYDLSASGIALPNITSQEPGPISVIVDGISEDVGIYYIENGQLIMVFNDENFLKNSKRGGSLTLNGQVKLSDVKQQNGDTGVIEIAGKEFTVTLDESAVASQIAVSKSTDNGPCTIDEATGLPKRMYTITITATSDMDNVDLQDVVSNGNILIDPDNIKVQGGTVEWKNDDLKTKYNDIDKTFYTGLKGTLSIKANQPITITYWAYGKEELYADGSGADKNTVTISSEKIPDGISNSADFWVNKPSISKWGSYDEKKGEVTWTITLRNQDGLDLKGTQVTDTLIEETEGSDYKQPYSGTVRITSQSGISTIDLAEFLENGYEFPDNSTDTEYTLTYTIELTEDAKSSFDPNKNVYNAVEMENEHYDFSDGVEKASVGVGKANPLKEKTGDLQEDGETIRWTSTIEVPEDPDEGLKNVIYHDWFDTTMTLVEGSVEVMEDDSPYRAYAVEAEEKSGYNAFKITFQETLKAGKTYTITYLTKIEDTTVKTYRNNANLDIDKITTGPVSKDVSLTSMLDKTGHPGEGEGEWNGNSAKHTWTLTIPRNIVTQMSGNYTIEDRLPEGCAYVEGSAKANYEELKINTTDPKKIVFDITDVVVNAKKDEYGWEGIKVTYLTRITDSDKFLASGYEGVTYKNVADLYHNTTKLDDAFAEVTSFPATDHIISKNYNYTKITAPNARYTIDVNPNSYDLLENGDTLTVVDTLPEDFEVIESSVEVIDGSSGDVLNDVTIKYVANVLEITIPDGRHVVIKYNVRINRAVGTELTDVNSTNKVTLMGNTSYSDEVSLSDVGVVLQGNATAGSESRTLTINKYSGTHDNLLSGATFKIELVKYENGSYVEVEQSEVSDIHQVSRNFTTDENGSFTVTNLLYDWIYRVSEETPPEGYEKDPTPYYYVFIHEKKEEDFPPDVNICQTSITEYIENKPIEDMAFFSKQTVGGEELPGATITLYDADGKEVTSWVSGTSAKNIKIGDKTIRDGNGNITQLAAGTYTMRETGAPEGYAYAEDITFTVDEKGKITIIGQNGEVTQNGTKLIMRDKALGYIYISKKAIGGSEELPGAHIVLTERATGKLIAEWDSGNEAYKLSGNLFKADTEYVLTETISPKGYDVTEKIIFRIDRDGTLLLSADNKNEDVELADYNESSYNNQIIIRDNVSETTEEKTTEDKTTEDKTTEEKTTEDKTTEKKKKTTSKKTGDEMPIVGMALLYGMSITGIIVLQRKKKQKKQ